MATGGIVQLIYNPTAGRHCAKRLDALRLGFEAGGARVILSESAPGLTLSIHEEAGHVCAIGGDGTVRHVALALARSGRALPLSAYPGGTVNLLHREFTAPAEPATYAARALSGEAGCLHYAAEINDTLFLACASAGIVIGVISQTGLAQAPARQACLCRRFPARAVTLGAAVDPAGLRRPRHSLRGVLRRQRPLLCRPVELRARGLPHRPLAPRRCPLPVGAAARESDRRRGRSGGLHLHRSHRRGRQAVPPPGRRRHRRRTACPHRPSRRAFHLPLRLNGSRARGRADARLSPSAPCRCWRA